MSSSFLQVSRKSQWRCSPVRWLLLLLGGRCCCWMPLALTAHSHSVSQALAAVHRCIATGTTCSEYLTSTSRYSSTCTYLHVSRVTGRRPCTGDTPFFLSIECGQVGVGNTACRPCTCQAWTRIGHAGDAAHKEGERRGRVPTTACALIRGV